MVVVVVVVGLFFFGFFFFCLHWKFQIFLQLRFRNVTVMRLGVGFFYIHCSRHLVDSFNLEIYSLQFWTFLLYYFFDNSFIFIFSILSLRNLFWLKLNLLDEFSNYLSFPSHFSFLPLGDFFSFIFQFLFQIFLVLLSYF